MAAYHDEIEIEDMEFDEETETYYYPCPCGDRFQITKVEFCVYYNYKPKASKGRWSSKLALLYKWSFVV